MFTRTLDLRIPLPSSQAHLLGQLTLPSDPAGLVVFAQASGSSHRSPHHRCVAARLHAAGLATALADLLSLDEAREDAVTRHLSVDVPLLAHRLHHVVAHVRASCAECERLPVGVFGASTGGAAAIEAAALHPDVIRAVVCRGGRPDLACSSLLCKLTAPTLLIVGGADSAALVEANERALGRMEKCEQRRLEVVDRATHLFEEAGALERVAELSAQWFTRWLLGEQKERRQAETDAEETTEAEDGRDGADAEGKTFVHEEEEA